MPVTFHLDKESDSVAWDYQEDTPALTEQQALIISASRMSWALGDIADGLQAIAEAIRGGAAAGGPGPGGGGGPRFGGGR
jgi:hypothetical protein